MAATNAALASGGMTNCCFRCGLRRFFSASARSCYRWPGRRCSVPQPGLPAGATSIARAPWVVLSRPGRSAWPLWRRRKYGALADDGEKEAKLIALACSEPPKGHARWTLRLLEDKVVELNIVGRVSDNTIGRTLKKTFLSRT